MKSGSMSDGQPSEDGQETATEDDSGAVLSSLGEGWGFYQIRLLIYLTISGMVVGIVITSPGLLFAVPKHQCLLPKNVSYTRPSNADDQSCHLETTDNVTESGLISCPFGWEYNTTGFIDTAIVDMNWVCQDSWVGPFLQSIFYMGSVLGTILYGWTADRFGRYPIFIAANVILAISGICLPLCTDTVCFASVRFVMGMNWSACYGTMMVLVLEYIPRTKRSLAPLTRALGTALSKSIMPWLLKVLGDWKLFQQVIFAVPLFVLLTPLTMHESVRWLLARGKTDKAVEILAAISKTNGKTVSVDNLRQNIEEVAEKLQATKSGLSTNFFKFLWMPNLRRNILLMFVTWVNTTIGYHAWTLLIYSSLLNDFDIVTASTIAAVLDLPAGLVASFLVHQLGKRPTIWLAHMTSGISAVICAVLVGQNTASFLVFVLLGRAIMYMAFTAQYEMTFEMFPTAIRAQGGAWASSLANVSAFLAPYVPYSGTLFPGIPFYILCGFSLIASTTALFLPETGDSKLPNTLEEGEEFGKDQAFFHLLFIERRKKKESASS